MISMLHHTYRQNTRGVALVAVLWIVAALSLMVTGLSQAVRSEIRTITTTRQTVVATAIAQAAIQLALQKLKVLAPLPNKVIQIQVTFEGQTLAVEAMPLNGLIDINNAPGALLALLYNTAGHLDMTSATALAQNTTDTRSIQDTRGRPLGFESIEDLMRVPGMSYPLYASIAPLVTADSRSGGRVNPLAAPLPVLAVLAEGNVTNAANFVNQREAGETNPDTTLLNGQYLDTSSSTRMRLEVRVPLSGSGQLVRTSIINLSDNRAQGLPWRIYYSYQRTESPTPSAPHS